MDMQPFGKRQGTRCEKQRFSFPPVLCLLSSGLCVFVFVGAYGYTAVWQEARDKRRETKIFISARSLSSVLWSLYSVFVGSYGYTTDKGEKGEYKMAIDIKTANEILNKYVKTEHLKVHAYTVEGVMRHFARLLGEDEERWGIVGLLHDIDYELYPEEHCVAAVRILKDEGVDDECIHSVVSHGYGMTETDAVPEHIMEKVLYTIDELTGLVTATALMHPSRSVSDLEVSSVKKKFKTPAFAAKVNREVISKGAEMLGMELDYIIEHTILGMREVREKIGL